MHLFRFSVSALTAVAACVAIAAVAEAQTPRAPLTLEPIGASGEAIWPAFESWARNEDGTLTLLLGYMNRNDEVVEIPIGNDDSSAPGDGNTRQCCWTTAHVDVTVNPSGRRGRQDPDDGRISAIWPAAKR